MPGGRTLNQHPGLASYESPAPPLTRPSGTQVPCHHHGVQSHASHVIDSHRGLSNLRHETPVNFTHGARQPVNFQGIHTHHHTGQPQAFFQGHIVRSRPSRLGVIFMNNLCTSRPSHLRSKGTSLRVNRRRIFNPHRQGFRMHNRSQP